MVAIASAVSWVVRYRILNMYSRLPPEPQRKEPDIDLFPDTHEDGMKSGLSNYLDEFLSAIKIFGYLERPVFHELTRSMQTRKLIAGETINLEEEKGFCIVVDGLVEIFVKTGQDARSSGYSSTDQSCHDSSEDEEYMSRGQQKYHLLTEVKNGAPMSSLFSIMSLFTEDVKLKVTNDEASTQEERPEMGPFVPASMPNTPNLDARSGRHAIVAGHDPHGQASLGVAGSTIPPMSLEDTVPTIHQPSHRPKPPKRRVSQSAHPDIIARATVDTTIAIIPAQAFRRLIKIYPKATAHIVQVILSRFHRVTLAHAFNYLGLTGEVLQTEKNILKYTSCQLPNILRGDALSRLKEKFKRERERMKDSEEPKGIALHNSAVSRRRRSSTTLRKEAVLHALAQHRTSSMSSNVDPVQERSGQPPRSQPGDLLANINQARNPPRPSGTEPKTPLAQRSFNPFDSEKHARISMDPRDLAEEDDLFRTSILECIFKTLGLDGDSGSREPDSIEASPRLGSMDQRRSRVVFPNNAFGFMGPFENSVDGESESVTSSSMGIHSTPSAYILSQEMKNEMEIVFFPKGSVLIQQGERSPGLYYVVDGFLDIGVKKEASRDILRKSRPKAADSKSPQTTADSTHEMTPSDTPKSTSRRRSVAWVKPGGIAGYISGVSSYRSYIDVVAKTDVYVGFLPRPALERIIDKYPIILLTMAKRLTSILPRLILHIDFALEWVQVNAGQVLFHNGDESEAIYVVLNGRLRLVEERKDGGVEAKAEYGQGESVGELEVLTETARSGTLHAIRDTELVKFPRSLFNSLAQEHPNITIKISKIIATRMRAMIDDPSTLLDADISSGALRNHGKSTMNLRTVAILPVTAGVPVVDFSNRLMNALSQMSMANGATSLNQAAILNHLGKHAFNKIGKLRLSQYLADLEEKYGLVVYVAGKHKFPFPQMFPSSFCNRMMRKTQSQRQCR